MKKLLIVNVAGLSTELAWDGPPFHRAQTVFPAVTCTVQASFRTATAPGKHGMVANGLFWRELRRAFFWEQSAKLVAGPRIWDRFREHGGRVGLLFWQQSLGEDVDLILSPAPLHKHHGGMIQDCYSHPAGLYDTLCRVVGSSFKLHHYWGPMARPEVGTWIAQATEAVLSDPGSAPDLCLTYLPTLDYELQRQGPTEHRAVKRSIEAVGRQLNGLYATARAQKFEMLVFGDYHIAATRHPVLPNRALLEAGLMRIRTVRGMQYPDLWHSRAFAMVDHQIAHVYTSGQEETARAAEVLRATDGVGEVLEREAQEEYGIAHPRSGELMVVADQGYWFAYPWWKEQNHAPDYAGHVDIHNKPGYDPCELFFGWPPGSVSQDPARVRGTHGRIGSGRHIVWASTFALDREPSTLIDLAAAVKCWLSRQ